MSLEKSIKHGKEHRKPLRGSQRFDWSCRNHGSCSWCKDSRTFQFHKEELRTEDQVDEWFGYWFQGCEIDAISDHFDKLYEERGIDTWKPINPQLGTYTNTYDES